MTTRETRMEPKKPMAPMKPLEKMTAAERWWPDDLGEPNSSGSANDTRYAFFAAKHRLALQKGGKVRLFDTGATRINGFDQSQGRENAIRFASDDGPVRLDALKEL